MIFLDALLPMGDPIDESQLKNNRKWIDEIVSWEGYKSNQHQYC